MNVDRLFAEWKEKGVEVRAVVHLLVDDGKVFVRIAGNLVNLIEAEETPKGEATSMFLLQRGKGVGKGWKEWMLPESEGVATA